MTTTDPPLPPAHAVACGECGAPMDLKRSRFGLFYGCTTYPACTGTHGAHPDGAPLGVPANAATKAARIAAHAAFDTLWKGGAMTRGDAYRWLCSALGMTRDDCHIGRFDEATCARVIDAVKARG